MVSTGRAGTPPGSRCPLLVLVCDQDQSALAEPAVRAARRAPRGELVRMPGGHYEPFLGGHERAVEAELSFLRRHLLGELAGQPAGRDRGVRGAAGMNEIELSAGTIEYQDTGGDGPVLVLLHGLMMDASLWDERDRRPVRRPPLRGADPAARGAPSRRWHPAPTCRCPG